LRVLVCPADVEVDSIAGSIVLPFFETFVEHPGGFLTPECLNCLFERVSMPQLRQFIVPTSASKGPNSFYLLPLGRRSPLVEDLSAELKSVTMQSLPETLRSFPFLTKLCVWDRPNPNPDLDPGFQPCGAAQLLELLISSSQTILCPALQNLAIQTCKRFGQIRAGEVYSATD